MRRSNFALRLQPSLLDEARKLAESEGVALKQFHQRGASGKDFCPADGRIFYRQARRANPGRIARILKRAGKGNPPVAEDELPPEFVV